MSVSRLHSGASSRVITLAYHPWQGHKKLQRGQKPPKPAAPGVGGGGKQPAGDAEAPEAEEEEEPGAAAEETPEQLAARTERELSELASLTGAPLPGDGLLYAVPVCGPYGCARSSAPGTCTRGLYPASECHCSELSVLCDDERITSRAPR